MLKGLGKPLLALTLCVCTLAKSPSAVAAYSRDRASEARRGGSGEVRALVNRRGRVAAPKPYRVSRRAPVSQALLYTNGIAFLVLARQPRLFDSLAKNDALISQGQVHRMVTSCFLHGGVLHLACNTQSLRALSSPVERWFGPERFAATYFISGAAAHVSEGRVVPCSRDRFTMCFVAQASPVTS